VILTVREERGERMVGGRREGKGVGGKGKMKKK
jgi:hypothetical protein